MSFITDGAAGPGLGLPLATQHSQVPSPAHSQGLARWEEQHGLGKSFPESSGNTLVLVCPAMVQKKRAVGKHDKDVILGAMRRVR